MQMSTSRGCSNLEPITTIGLNSLITNNMGRIHQPVHPMLKRAKFTTG